MSPTRKKWGDIRVSTQRYMHIILRTALVPYQYRTVLVLYDVNGRSDWVDDLMKIAPN